MKYPQAKHTCDLVILNGELRVWVGNFDQEKHKNNHFHALLNMQCYVCKKRVEEIYVSAYSYTERRYHILVCCHGDEERSTLSELDMYTERNVLAAIAFTPKLSHANANESS